MGAWAYCEKCGAGSGPPTTQEVIDGFWECGCGEKNHHSMSKDDLLLDMDRRLENQAEAIRRLAGVVVKLKREMED